jgi:hypothetical protein
LITHTTLDEISRENTHVASECHEHQNKVHKQETPQKDRHKITLQASCSWLVKCSETNTTAAKTRQVIKGKLKEDKHELNASLVCAESTLQGSRAACGLISVNREDHGSQRADKYVLANLSKYTNQRRCSPPQQSLGWLNGDQR